MKAKILDSRSEDEATCYLCRISLAEYVQALPTTYQDYDIQREIVSNVFLDHLADTVLARRHIPSIVLVATAQDIKDDVLSVAEFKILDGLQRTFRLQSIYKTIEFISQLKNIAELQDWTKFKLSREYSSDLRQFNSNTKLLIQLLKYRDENGAESLQECFRDNTQWFEVWSGLTVDEEIRKMLTLNAGHKPVKTRHQLELLFLNLLPILRAQEKQFVLLREKDISATQFSKTREFGQFHFAHVLTSLLSLVEGKPVAPTTGLIQDIQTNEEKEEAYSELMTQEFLTTFVGFLIQLDKLLRDEFGESGITWVGREVTLAGLFAGVGKYALDSNETKEKALSYLLNILRKSPKLLDVGAFEKSRNSLDLSKVNIGSVNRSAVYNAMLDILKGNVGETVRWEQYFAGSST